MTDAQDRADAARWRAVRAGAEVGWLPDMGGHTYLSRFLDTTHPPHNLKAPEEIDAAVDKAFGLTHVPAAPPALPEGWKRGESNPDCVYRPDSGATAIFHRVGLVTLHDPDGDPVTFFLTELAQIVAYFQWRDANPEQEGS